MVARARQIDESFEDYKDNLKTEAYDLKMRLRLGPKLFKIFKDYLKSSTVNLDEDKYGKKYQDNKKPYTGRVNKKRI